MKVELTDKEIEKLGMDRGVWRRRWWIYGTFAVMLGVAFLLAWATPNHWNDWLEVACALPSLVIGTTVIIICFRRAEKEGKALLKELKTIQE